MHILLIEDEPVDQLVFRQLLKRTSITFNLEVVDSVEAGLAALGNNSFDIIFCDFNLPDGSAVSFLEKMRSEGYRIPVVIITSFTQEDWISVSMKKGGYNFLHKKRVDSKILEDTIVETIDYFNKSTSLTASLERTFLDEGFVTNWLGLKIGIIRVGVNGVIAEVQGDILDLLELPYPKEELKDKQLLDCFGERAPVVLEHFQIACNGGSISEVLKIGSVYFQFDYIPVRPEGKQVGGVSIVVKDVTLESITEGALNRSVKISRTSDKSDNPETGKLELGGSGNKKKKDRLFIKDKSQYVSLKLEDILWIEAYGDFVKVNCVSQSFVVIHKLSDALASLPDDEFIQVHRSYVIRLDKISQIDKTSVMIGENSIPVSRSFRGALFEKIDLF